MAMETRKRAVVNYSDLNDVGRPKAKSPKIDNGIRVKDYSLNKERALKKKAEDCLGDSCISYANKSGNHIFKFKTAMYELYKEETLKFYDGFNERSKTEAVGIEQSTDETKTVCVETIIRIHRKTQRGKGKLKFCMNMYHTKNKIMVNGPDTALFNKNHERIVKDILQRTNVQTLDKAVYSAVMTQLNNMIIDKSKLNKKSTEFNSLSDTDLGRLDRLVSKKQLHRGDKPHVGEQNLKVGEANLSNDFTHHTLSESENEGDEMNPIDFCPHCGKYVENGIAYDFCEYWHHYECEGLDTHEGCSNDENYICVSCRQDCNEELTHSLGNIDTCVQRNDETGLKQIEGMDTEGDGQGEAGTDMQEEERLKQSSSLTSVKKADSDIQTHVDDNVPIVIEENETELNDMVLGNMKENKKSQNIDLKAECKDTGKSNKPSKKVQKKRTIEYEELQENLNLSISYISKLERKLLELENSNKILRSDAKAEAAVNISDTALRTVNGLNIGQNPNTYSNSDRELEGLRDQMKNIEIENLKTRMTVMEQNLAAQRFHVYQNCPPPGFQTPSPHWPGLNQPYGPQMYTYMPPVAQPPMYLYTPYMQGPVPPPTYAAGPWMHPGIRPYVAPPIHVPQGPPTGQNGGGPAPTMMQPATGYTVEPQSQGKRANRSGDTESATPKVRSHTKKQKTKTVQEIYKLISDTKHGSEQGQQEESHKADTCDMNSGMADLMTELTDRSRINIKDIATTEPVQNSAALELNIQKPDSTHSSKNVENNGSDLGVVEDRSSEDKENHRNSFLCMGRATEAVLTNRQ